MHRIIDSLDHIPEINEILYVCDVTFYVNYASVLKGGGGEK